MGTGDHAANSMLLAYVQGVQKRLGQLEEAGVVDPENNREKKTAREAAAIRFLVENEVALSSDEKREYEAFLQREFFTKGDFGSLESFYAKTWDRLSEEGQAQMSHRVWEGVRRDEYQFSELPETVKKKEAERLHEMLSGGRRTSEDLQNIPENDRRDFVNTWEEGRHHDSYRVLDRPSFKQSVSLSSRETQAEAAIQHHEGDRSAATNAQAEQTTASVAAKAKSNVEVSEDFLGELNAPPKGKKPQTSLELPDR